MSTGRVGLVCFDISGTLTEGSTGPPLEGAAAVVRRVRERLPVRFVTNVTSRTHAQLAEHLATHGMLSDPAELVTPAKTARRILEVQGEAAGLLLCDGPVRADFAWFHEDPEGPSVLLATEGHDWRISELQPAFRRLLEGAILYTLQPNRYFRRGQELLTDVGPLAAFLGYASGREPHVLGKPSELLFDSIAHEANVPRERILMIGDDAEFDVSASVALGLTGLLVRTGKYQPGSEERVDPPPSAVLDSVAELPGWLGLAN